jgi:putative endonuclease
VEDRRDVRRELGRRGEEAAARHLERRGYEILARGVRLLRGEIDIVARRNGTLIFVEVKTRAGTGCGRPEESVTPSKQAQLRRLAQAFLMRHRWDDAPCRFDVIAVRFSDDDRPDISHFVDAF